MDGLGIISGEGEEGSRVRMKMGALLTVEPYCKFRQFLCNARFLPTISIE